MKPIKRNSLAAVVAAVVLSASQVSAQTVSERLNDLVTPKSDGLFYYKMGGGRAFTSAPRWQVTTIQIGLSARATGLSCGNFDPAITVENELNNIKNAGDRIMDQLQGAANAALSQLPGYILAKYDPAAYDFFMNNILRAEAKFSLATKSCESIQRQISAGQDPFEDFMKVSFGDTWKASVGTGGVNVEDVDRAASDPAQHNDGVNWFGERRAGLNQDPIWILQDTATAGYNKLLGRDSLSMAPPSGFQGEPVMRLFPTPSALRKWVADVLGDTRIGLCEGCEKGSISGQGLRSMVDQKKEIVYPLLESLHKGNTNPTLANLEQVSAPGVAVTAQVINALRSLDHYDAQIFLNKLLDEITLAKVIEEALTVQQLLRTGSRDADLIAYTTAANEVATAVATLDEEINSTLRDAEIRRRLVSSTIVEALNLFSAERSSGLSVERVEPKDARSIEGGAVRQ